MSDGSVVIIERSQDGDVETVVIEAKLGDGTVLGARTTIVASSDDVAQALADWVSSTFGNRDLDLSAIEA